MPNKTDDGKTGARAFGRAIRTPKGGEGGEPVASPGVAAAAAMKRRRAQAPPARYQTTIRLPREVAEQINTWLDARPGETFLAMVLHALRETYGLDIRDEHFPTRIYRVRRFRG